MNNVKISFFANRDLMKSVSFQDVLNFLEIIDQDFSTPLSKKTDLFLLCNKFLKSGDMAIAFDSDKRIVGILVGYISNAHSPLAFASVLGVHPLHRGKGIAHDLINKFINEGKKINKSLAGIRLYTSRSNIGAIQLYKKMGFVETQSPEKNRINDIHFVYYYV